MGLFGGPTKSRATREVRSMRVEVDILHDDLRRWERMLAGNGDASTVLNEMKEHIARWESYGLGHHVKSWR